MGTIKLPEEISHVVRLFITRCPDSDCWKTNGMGDDPHVGHIYRVSKTSITMECSVCGLHWCVTWASLGNSLMRKVNNKKLDQDERAIYFSLVSKLDKYVDTSFSGKRPPRKV